MSKKENEKARSDTDKLVDARGLAELLGVKEGWVRQNVKKIPHLKLGRLVRFELAEVLESFKSQ